MHSPPSVGLLGLGIIGSRVAERLRLAGHSVTAWSQTGRTGENLAESPQAVAESAEIIQIFLRDDAAVLAAIQTMLPALHHGHLLLNHATLSKKATLAAAELCQKAGAAYLDAPFTGSKMAAQNGKLCYYIGGDPALLERARPILEASSAQILPVGQVGDAMVLKIVTNLITAVTVQALSEAAAITQAQGVSLSALHTALKANTNYSTLIGMKLPAIENQDFEAHFSLINMLKDAQFAQELSQQAGCQTPALDCTTQAMLSARENGWENQDFSVISQLVKSAP